MNRSFSNRRGGFTLLEVMLVLGILVVLAMFVVPAVTGAGTDAKKKAAMALIGPSGTLSSAIEQFFVSVGRYPEELKDLIERPDDLEEDDPRWYAFLKDSSSFNDPWGNELIYTQPGDVNEDGYDLVSKGPDAKEDTEDDITNYRKDKR